MASTGWKSITTFCIGITLVLHGIYQYADYLTVHREDYLEKQYNMAERVKKKCEELKIGKTTLTAYKLKWLFFNVKLKKAFCLQPKSASTSFQSALAQAYNQTDDMFKKVDGETPYKDGEIYQGSVFGTSYLAGNLLSHNYDTFATVRNPFTRLLSAYKFRIIPHNEQITKNHSLPFYFHDPVPLRVAKFAKEADSYFWKHGVTFETFLKYVVWEKKHKKRVNLLWISFEEFCMPCTIQYDYIGRFEDMAETVKHLSQILYRNENTLTKTFPRFNVNHQKTKKVFKRYYSGVSNAVIKDIVNVFRFDFELIGYDQSLYQ